MAEESAIEYLKCFPLGRVRVPRLMNFRKSSIGGGGGGGHFQSEIYIADFGRLNKAFLKHEVDAKGSFKGSGFLNNLTFSKYFIRPL